MRYTTISEKQLTKMVMGLAKKYENKNDKEKVVSNLSKELKEEIEKLREKFQPDVLIVFGGFGSYEIEREDGANELRQFVEWVLKREVYFD